MWSMHSVLLEVDRREQFSEIQLGGVHTWPFRADLQSRLEHMLEGILAMIWSSLLTLWICFLDCDTQITEIVCLSKHKTQIINISLPLIVI